MVGAAVRPVRAHRHRGAAGLAAGLADGRPGAGVLVPASRPATPRPTREAVRQAAEEKELRSPLQRAYVPVLRFATRRRLDHRCSSAAAGARRHRSAWPPQLKTNFFDQSGQDTLSITQKLPVGTSLAATDEAAKKVEEVLAGPTGVQDLPGHRRRRRRPARRRRRRRRQRRHLLRHARQDGPTCPSCRTTLRGQPDGLCRGRRDQRSAGRRRRVRRHQTCRWSSQAADAEALRTATEQVRDGDGRGWPTSATSPPTSRGSAPRVRGHRRPGRGRPGRAHRGGHRAVGGRRRSGALRWVSYTLDGAQQHRGAARRCDAGRDLAQVEALPLIRRRAGEARRRSPTWPQSTARCR